MLFDTPLCHRIVPLMAGLLLLCFMALGWVGCQSGVTNSVTAEVPNLKSDALKALLPQTVGEGKPVILDFNSRFCLACQLVTPKLEKVAEAKPEITLLGIDINNTRPEDKPVLDAFDVVTVPYVVFITGKGEITQVFQDDMPQAELDAAVSALVSGQNPQQ